MKSCNVFVYLPLVVALFATSAASGALPANCKVGQDCLIDVEGSACADGTKSFYQVTLRPNAKKLLIYLSGGGACWDKKSCESGYASSLTRKEGYVNWEGGRGIHDASAAKNPFAKDYNIITVPYCTGDVHAGARTANYGTRANPLVIQHHGYQNILNTLKAVKDNFPEPEKVVMLGCSAGGIGAYYHLRNLAATYPDAPKYVVSDAGTPFKPPYLYAKNYDNVMKAWGAEGTLPAPLPNGSMKHFGDLIHSNTVLYPDVRFGFISSYRDVVMTFFSLSVGSPSAQTAVKNIIIDVANNDIGKDAELQKVFYTESSRHCHTGENLDGVTSLDTDLGQWMTAMVSDKYDVWETVRPDLHRRVRSSADAQEDPKPRNITELNEVLERR